MNLCGTGHVQDCRPMTLTLTRKGYTQKGTKM